MEEAEKNAEISINLWLEGVKSTGHDVHPPDDPDPEMALEKIHDVKKYLNLSNLARESGINKHTLRNKLQRGTKFTNRKPGNC